ncbi:MAG TPA: hypothetical protein VFK03_02460 [Candidatus Saccharimonadales bacterium]|nr:hypothetical protein [Candidatus Saccharimonadales bacterium]
MRVEHVNNLEDARKRLNMAGLVAESFRRDPCAAIRRFPASRIRQAVEDAYAVFLYVCPIFARHSDPLHPEATPELELAAGYMPVLIRAMQDHPDADESSVCTAQIYGTAVELMLDNMDLKLSA